MKKLFTLFIFLVCTCSHSATVTFTMTNQITGNPDTNAIKIFGVNPHINADGSFSTIGFPTKIQPNTNGIYTWTNMSAGLWLATNQFIVSQFTQPGNVGSSQGVLFLVDNSTNTYPFTRYPASSGGNGYNVFNWILGVKGIIGTNGFNAINNSDGTVTLDGASFVVTINLAAISNALGGVPILGNVATNAFYLTSNPSFFVSASITNGLATTNYVNASTNGLVTSAITNALTASAYTSKSYFQPASANLTNWSGVDTNLYARTNSPFFDVSGAALASGAASTNNAMALSNNVYRAGTNAVSSQSAFNATNGMGNGAFSDTNKFATLIQATNIASAMTNGFQQGITNTINAVAGSGNFISRNPGGTGTNTILYSTNSANALTLVGAPGNDVLVVTNGVGSSIRFYSSYPGSQQGTNIQIALTDAGNTAPIPRSHFVFIIGTTNGTKTALSLFGFDTNADAGFSAPSAYLNSLWLGGIRATNFTTIGAGSGVTISTNGVNYTISANSQTNNAIFQSGNFSNGIIQTTLALANNPFLSIGTNVVGMTNNGNVAADGTPANGTYFFNGNYLTNQYGNGFAIGFSSPNYLFISNGVTLQTATSLNQAAWSVVSGAAGAAGTYVGSTWNMSGTVLIGPVSSSNITAQIASAIRVATNNSLATMTNIASAVTNTTAIVRTDNSHFVNSLTNNDTRTVTLNGDVIFTNTAKKLNVTNNSVSIRSGSIFLSDDDDIDGPASISIPGNSGGIKIFDSANGGTITLDNGIDFSDGGRGFHFLASSRMFGDGFGLTDIQGSNMVGQIPLANLNSATTNSGRISTNFTLLTGQSLTNFVNTNAINLTNFVLATSNTLFAAQSGTTNLTNFNVNTNLFIAGVSQEETFGDTIKLGGSSNALNNLTYSRSGIYWTNFGSGYSVFTNTVSGTNRYNNRDSSGNISFFRNGSPQGPWSQNFITTNPPTGDWGRLVNQGVGGGAEGLVWSNAVFRGPVTGDNFILRPDGSADFRGLVSIATLHATNEIVDVIETNAIIVGNALKITNTSLAFITNPASASMFWVGTNSSVFIGSANNDNINSGYFQIATNGVTEIGGGSDAVSGSSSKIRVSSGTAAGEGGNGYIEFDVDDLTGVNTFTPFGGLTLMGQLGGNLTMGQFDFSTNGEGVLDAYVSIGNCTPMGRSLHLVPEHGGWVDLDAMAVSVTNDLYVTGTTYAGGVNCDSVSTGAINADDLTTIGLTIDSVAIISDGAGTLTANSFAVNGGSFRGNGSALTNIPAAGISTNGSAAGQVLESVGGVTAWSSNARSLTNQITTNIVATAAGDSSRAGFLGEFTNKLVTSGSAQALVNNTPTNITSILLAAGDWDVQGSVHFSLSGATTTSFKAGINTTSATIPTDGSEGYSAVITTLLTDTETITIARVRVNVSSATTVYLVGQSAFSAGSESVFGNLSARRAR